MMATPMTPMTPEQIDSLKREVLAAEQAALDASRRVEVDRVKHAAQLHELSEQVNTAKIIAENSPAALTPLKTPQRSPLSPGMPSPSRFLQSEKRALDKKLREQQGTDRVLERELSQLQDQFSDVEEVYAPVGPFEYAPCEIVSVDKSHIILIRKDTKECIECPLDQIMPQDPATVELPDNLIKLEYLNQPALLQALQGIWSEHSAQVLCGPNMISMCDPTLQDGMDSSPESAHTNRVLQERVRAVLTAAFDDGQMRAFICQGVEGTGKTHTARLIVDTMLSPFETEVNTHAGPTSGVVELWRHTCQILDAFGSSGATSRCSSFFEVQLGQAGTNTRIIDPLESHSHDVSNVLGVAVTCFGLESNQVVRQRENQRNFNAFYTLCAAAESPELVHLRLRDAGSFNYLSSGAARMENDVEFSDLEASLSSLGIDQGEADQIWSVMAAILHLGDLTFEAVEQNVMNVTPAITVRTIAGLLSVDPIELTHTLSHLGQDPNRKSMGSRHRPEVMAEMARDALARILYDRMFNFLIQRLNDCTCADVSKALVAVLDPAGAILTDEQSKGNFQTLLRNYGHERMCHTFTTLMFTNHQTRMRAEGIVPLTDLEAPDMAGRIELLEKKGGIFSIIDEIQSLPQATPAALYQKMVSALIDHPDFHAQSSQGGQSPARLMNAGFSVRHSFGECLYDPKDFLDVDGDDSFSASLRILLGTSSSLLLQLFPALLTGDPSRYVNSMHVTKSSMMRAQLASLKQMLAPATVMFVHCVAVKKRGSAPSSDWARAFNMRDVQGQLEAMCVLPSILWQRFGYPISMPLEAFWDRFFMLGPIRERSPLHPFPDDSLVGAIHALLSLQPFEKHHWRIGKTMVFLRPGPYATMENTRLKLLLRSAAVISSRIRRQRVFRFMQARKMAMQSLQPVLRGMLTRQLFTRALNMAFMKFSDRESANFRAECHAEKAREERELARMRQEEEESRSSWEAIEEAHSSEDADLVLMYHELLRSRALNAQWKLARFMPDPVFDEQLDHVTAGNEVYRLDDVNHEESLTLYEDITDAAVEAVLESAMDTITDVLANAEMEAAESQAEDQLAEVNRARMQFEDEYLNKIDTENRTRQILSPAHEHAMMSEAAASQRIRERMQAHKAIEARIKAADNEAVSQEADDHHEQAGQSLMDVLLSGANQLLSTMNDNVDPAQLAAQDRLLEAEENQMMVTDLMDEIIAEAERTGRKNLLMRVAISETELRKRDIEERRQQQDMLMDDERRLAAEQMSRMREKQKAREAELESRKAELQEMVANKKRQDALGGDPAEEVSPRVAKFRMERGSEGWKHKRDRYEQSILSPSAGSGMLTKQQQSIEDELQSLQTLLFMTQGANETQTIDLLDRDNKANEKDFKYMFKYKYKALVVDDDNELMS
eukprot:TRINITY_DN1783_c0_g1_i1.p1 TRINITY_DN1783_c0_g1~~TRINITY_DN1783_c0_g1_i1.p1  ORF type:complete len:1404 (+),score=419.27 TRINITY_DN1783_c0_g1_i1:184-4395(+)